MRVTLIVIIIIIGLIEKKKNLQTLVHGVISSINQIFFGINILSHSLKKGMVILN